MAAWVVGVPLALALVLYVVLLFRPIPLPFLGTQVRNAVVSAMPPGSELELGDMALAIEGFAWPVLQFSPVTYKDNVSGGKVEMEALEVGFSPIRALIGQPGASITMVGPHIQINQDIFGPRLSNFEVVPDPDGGPSTVRILEGTSGFPDVGFSANGIQISGDNSAKVRSDNDWLIYNLEAAQTGIAGIIEQARLGRFSRFVLKRGTLEMNDAIYGTLRTFNDINFDIAPTPDGKVAEGLFSTEYGGTVMKGILERVIDEQGDARLRASITNFNLAKFIPSSDSGTGSVGLDGTTAVSVDVGFAADTGKILDGKFHVDLTGMSVVVGPDIFPIATSIMEVDWQPQEGIFTLPEAAITIGQTSAKFHGVFVLGLDDLYGPTVGISMAGRDVRVHPNDMEAPEAGFDMSFKGWSAPLYGALGIDQSIFSKPGARIEARGRIDTVRKGMGVDLTVAGQGLTADDLKRLWPYFTGREARDWFVKNVTAGVIDSANMKFSIPVGSIPADITQAAALPDNSVFMEMVASGVTVQPVDSLAPIQVRGKTRLQLHDSEFTMAGQDGTIVTDKGNIEIANAAMVYSPNGPDESLFEISGSMSGKIPAVLAAVEKIQPGALKAQDMPIDPSSLDGMLTVGMLSTTALDNKGAIKRTDYSVNGNVQDFGSTQPMEGHTISNGQLSFMATQDGYSVGGQAMVDGLTANLSVSGEVDGSAPQMILTSNIGVADMKKFGFDAGPFMSGEVGFTAKPNADGTIEIALDLTPTALNIKDIGLTKEAGVAGSLRATIRQQGDISDVSDVNLNFGDVRLKGGMLYDAKNGLQSAEFTDFALSEGDSAQISVKPIKDGFQVVVRGDQLDMKPMLKRFFDTTGTSGAGGGSDAAKPQFTQAILADVELKRAIGFYKTSMVNLDASFDIKGDDVRKVSVQTQLSNGSSLSVTTNPNDTGRTMIVAFNDMGSLLRLIGVYAQVEGGSGTLVMQTDTSQKVDTGEFTLKNFAIVDEAKVAEVLSSHAESRKLIADRNKLAFRSAKVDFVRRSDRIQVTEGLLSGETVGGTIKGYIYPNEKRLDMAGTYVPMFGMNNAFARMFGPLGGSRNEGLFGVSFAVTGPIDKPNVKINPLSALVPGAFRSLFDFRAKEDPGD